MNPKVDVSLIVLTYNRPAPLKRCLESIACMDKGGASFEVLVVDDGSTSDNKSVIDGFRGRLDIEYLLKPRGGVASARNHGGAHARGGLIAFIADDYILPPDYIKDTTEFLAANPDAWIITHNILPTGPSIFRYAQRLYYQMTLLQRFSSKDFRSSVLESFGLPPSRAAVFRKEMFDITGWFNEKLLTGEDGDLGMRMAAEGIPVYFFVDKYIKHWEEKDLSGYLEQRTRYGASFYRVLKDRDGNRMTEPSLSWVVKSVSERYISWLRLSFKLGRKTEFILLTPLTLLFLSFYFRGYYSESKRAAPSEGVVAAQAERPGQGAPDEQRKTSLNPE
ncbi:MAG TPA: glycosyltransferase family A protein [Thermodesulfobacteriota bacterium]|nr:glycosyltransferase family A protein [Thermodesulfobacteriota bacterium]